MKNSIVPFILVLLVFSLAGCARKGRPSGGPKDEQAPIMVTANPPYKSTHFQQNNIELFFDEYIQLKELQKQLVVSPPLKYPAIITPQGIASKIVNINILDTLQKNTTYTFNFGNAIQDNNERNLLEQFSFVFSTGDYIDSLTLKGRVVDALTKTPTENYRLLLYKIDSSYTDSLVYFQKPSYVGGTLDSLHFQLENLQKNKYALVALQDLDNNYLFDPRTEKIGFYSEVLSLPTDSLVTKDISLFYEQQPFVFKKATEPSKGKIIFGYQGDKGDFSVEILSKTPESFKAFTAFDTKTDSLHYWYTPYGIDSLQFRIAQQNNIDTLTVKLRKKQLDSLSISTNISSVLHRRDTLFLQSNNPITNIDASHFSLTDRDTVAIAHTIHQTTPQKIAVAFERKDKTSYRLLVYPKAITDVFSIQNDSLSFRFSTKEREDYGSISVLVQLPNNTPVLLELLTEKGKLVAQQYLEKNTTVLWSGLLPKKYLIRALVDSNRNKKWDTGNYLNKRAPEAVHYYPNALQVRANWDLMESFKIE